MTDYACTCPQNMKIMVTKVTDYTYTTISYHFDKRRILEEEYFFNTTGPFKGTARQGGQQQGTIRLFAHGGQSVVSSPNMQHHPFNTINHTAIANISRDNPPGSTAARNQATAQPEGRALFRLSICSTILSTPCITPPHIPTLCSDSTFAAPVAPLFKIYHFESVCRQLEAFLPTRVNVFTQFFSAGAAIIDGYILRRIGS